MKLGSYVYILGLMVGVVSGSITLYLCQMCISGDYRQVN